MGPFKKVGGRSPDQIEMDRILALPTRHQCDEEDVEIESFERLTAEAFDRGERLLPTQVDALRQFEACRGAFLPIGVGFGKSGISLMCSEIGLTRGWARRVLLLVPVHLIAGLMRRHVPEWRKRVGLHATIHIISGDRKRRLKIASSGAPGIYVMPYSLMSTPDTLDILNAIDADLVIADEAHRLKNPRSACTKRLLHVMRERPVRPLFVAMSGSMTVKSINEYQHLIDLALGDGSPVPRRPGLAFSWGMVIDANATPQPAMVAGLFGPIMDWAERNFPETYHKKSSRVSIDLARAAFRHRLTTAPGVVATGDERPSASLVIANLEDIPAPGGKLTELAVRVKENYETPEGEPIDHAIHAYKWLSELTCGFYNALVWPQVADLAKHRRISEGEAGQRLEAAKAHLKALQRYHGVLREFFKEAPVGLDTPTDVALSIVRHGAQFVGGEVATAYQSVRAADFEGRPERLSIPIRVDDFKVRAVVDWAKEYKKGIVWVYHTEFGNWLMEALTAAGLDPVHAPSGADAVIEGIGDFSQGGKGDRLVVASIPAHGVGRNLQAFENQLFAEWPRSAMLAEQTLGRVHRTGQPLEEVVAHTLIATEFDSMNRAATLVDAVYAKATMGSAQRVLYADYTQPPQVFDPRILRKAGMSPLTADPAIWEAIREQFGQ